MSQPEATAGPARRRLDLRALRRPGVAIPLVLVVAVGVWFVGFRDDGSASSAATATQQLVAVTKGPIGNTVSAEGTIAAARTANLTFPSSGTVTSVNVEAGDSVTAGEVLATVNSSQLAASASSAQAAVASAQAKVSDDEAAGASAAQLTADQAGLQTATDTATTAQQALADASLTAPFDGTIAAVGVTPGESLSSSGTGGVSQTGSATGSGQSASASSSSSSGSFGGGSGAGSSSAASSSSSAAIQEITKGQYTVTLSVPASDVGNVQVGQSATVTVTTSSTGGRFGGGFGGRDAGGTTGAAGTNGGGAATGSGAAGATGGAVGASATGAVTSVSQVASTSSGAAGYPVVVTFDADANSFFVGGTVTAAIATNAKNDVIQVPTRALSTRNGKPVVVVATSGKLGGPTATRSVTTGITAGGETEITSGLRAGEQVVITLPSFFGTTGGTGRTGTGGFGGNGGTGTRSAGGRSAGGAG